MSKSITPRPNYLSTPGADRAAYLQTQRDLFGACRDNGLPVEGEARDKMILAIARYFGDIYITSRKQLTPAENRLITEAVNRKFFNAEWLLNPYTQTATMLRSILEGNERRAHAAYVRAATALRDFDFDSIID